MTTKSRSAAEPRQSEPTLPMSSSWLQPEGHDEELPLSPLQERLWFLHQLDPSCAARVRAFAIRVTGPIDVRILSSALNEIIRRNGALRAVFLTNDGRPTQMISAPQTLTLPSVDLTDVPPGEREFRAMELAREQARHPFNLAEGPLLRAHWLRFTPEEHWLVLAVHPIIFDRRSMAILSNQLAELYEALSRGQLSRLTKPPFPYLEYARRQPERLQGELLQAQLSYWKQQLAGSLPILELPSDRPRPAAQSHAALRQPITLSPSLSARVQTFSEQQHVTPFVTLVAVFLTLLHRYTGMEDLLIGAPAGGRCTEEWEQLIGPLENSLVLRADLSGNPAFAGLLQRVHAVTQAAYAHQEIPFEAVVEGLQPARDRSRSPLFQVLFRLDEEAPPSVKGAGITFETHEVDTDASDFDLSLHLSGSSGSLEGWFEYATDLFDAPTVARMASQFETLLDGAIGDPERRLWDLPLLTNRERRQVLRDWNDTRADSPPDGCFHRLFEQQVARTPEAPAVVFERQSLTYAELNARANQLAHFLQRRAVGPEVRVGLCVERSLEMVVALLAVHKAGGAYLPLDPSFPRERLAFVLEDAQVPLLLTQQSLLRDHLPPHGAETVCLDTDRELFERESAANLPVNPAPEQLAYVLYTSGSTGQPKGVAIPHCALLNFLASMQRQPGLAATDRLLAVTTLAFDIAGLELFLPLLAGARLEVAARDVPADPRLLAERLAAGATVMQATPATWRLLLEGGWPGQPDLTVLCGGEALPTEPAARLRPRCAALWNLYGPTETTIWSALRPVGETESGAVVPIGRPIANTQLYLLDRTGQPVPIGVPGELYIGGAGLARGYLNRPELTAERFVPDPFGERAGARLYRTGDLARARADGTLEFLGRIDQQVKVRGFRIELGEIEAALRQHPQIREAVVVAREEAAGEKRLVAYLVAAGEGAPGSSELRFWLQQQLPEYMVPALFLTLEALPLTPNGKVDRNALPAPEERARERVFMAPQDPLERQLVQIWEEVLNIRPVGLSDSFFDLGGHSLLAVRLFARIENTWGKSLPLATLFQAPTAGQLAALLRDHGWSPPWSCLVPIQPAGTKPPFFCMHGAGANVLYLQTLSRHLPPDQPFYGIQSLGLDQKQAPHTRVEEMAAHYIGEIRTVQPHGPYFLGGYSFGGVVAFEMAQQFLAMGQEVALVAMFNSSIGSPRYISDVSSFRAKVYPRIEAAERRLDDVRAAITHHSDLVNRLGRRAYLRKEAGVAGRLIVRAVGNAARKLTRRSQPVRTDESDMPPHLLNIWLLNNEAERQYEPRVYPGRVTLFWASGMTVTFHDQYSPLGWNEFAGDGLEVHVIPGNHFTFREEPHVTVLAAKLTACLERAQAAVCRKQVSPSGPC